MAYRWFGRSSSAALAGALAVALAWSSGAQAEGSADWTVGSVAIIVPAERFGSEWTAEGQAPLLVTVFDTNPEQYLLTVQVPKTVSIKDGAQQTVYQAAVSLGGAPGVGDLGSFWQLELTGSPAGTAYPLSVTAGISKVWGPTDLAGAYTGTITITFIPSIR